MGKLVQNDLRENTLLLLIYIPEINDQIIPKALQIFYCHGLTSMIFDNLSRNISDISQQFP